jgi:molecular chaperone HscB
MNYFELFEMPVRLKVNRNEARKKYFELSRKFHPDYFVQQGAGEQQEALDASAQLNKALKTFSDPDDTIRYVLTLKGLVEEEEKYTLAPEFLMQMMEVNEALADAQMEDDEKKKQQLLKELDQIENEIYEPVESIVENYEEGAASEKELLQVKEYYYRKKYLTRLRQQFGGKS